MTRLGNSFEFLTIGVLLTAPLAPLVGCQPSGATINLNQTNSSSGGSTGSTSPGNPSAGGSAATGNTPITSVNIGAGGAGSCTKRTTCEFNGFKFCGEVGDGCDGKLDCGGCASDETCIKNQCVKPNCVPATCTPAGGEYCGGEFADRCGGTIKCGDCSKAGWTCQNNICVGGASCEKLTSCKPVGGQYCGQLGDGCGGVLDCSDPCPTNFECKDRLCVGTDACQRKTCQLASGGAYCGKMGDGCGGTIECSPADCPANATCVEGVCIPPCVGEKCPTCKGLECQVKECAGGTKTSISGTVYDPAGKVPVFGAIVYVPSAPLDPITTGASCEKCGSVPSGKPLTVAVTDTAGKFSLKAAPSGANIPLVIQVGKWRRQVTIPTVGDCKDNPITDKNLTRLPKNKSEGTLPKIALVAGDADRLQCLLYRMGVDVSEFTNPTGTGAVNIYNQPSSLGPDQGGGYDSTVNGGAKYPDAVAFWENLTSMLKYDMIMLACGGVQSATDPRKYAPYYNQTDPSPISDLAKANLVKYLAAGGRAFGEHYHWAWIKGFPSDKPDDIRYPAVPSPFGTEVATWIPYSSTTGVAATGTIDQSFPKGKSFADWLVKVGASTTLGSLQLNTDVKPTAQDQINPPGQRWIYEPTSAGAATAAKTHYLSFNAPIGAAPENQCGRFVYTGLHVTGGPDDPNPDPKKTFPSTCLQRDLSTAEKALEFMVFDLSSCIAPDDTYIIPPPPEETAPPPVGEAAPPPPPPPPPPPVTSIFL